MSSFNEYSMESLGSKFVKNTYIRQGIQNIAHRNHILEHLLRHHKLPKDGLDDHTIEYILHEISIMDSNNFYSNVGVGEREGRVFSSLVQRRHYQFAHGIGRSGDLAEVQPKAAGSSLLYKLTNILSLEVMKIAGVGAMEECLVVPLCTGMSISLVLQSLQTKSDAKLVIWSRIDQKSCFKAILAAGLVPIIIDPIMTIDGQLQTNIEAILHTIVSYGPENILSIITTTSCFAPRQPDRIDEVAKLCSQHYINHIINNAYGLQSSSICKLINRACAIGRVDAIIQSTDKNFLVPVGGAIISSPSSTIIHHISSIYPGRASASPIIDLFITLLSMGESGYKKLLYDRISCFQSLQHDISTFVAHHDGRILPSPYNDISIAIELSSLNQCSSYDATFFGSMLFQREVSGCRVITMTEKSTIINKYSFMNWGSHIDHYHPECRCYLTVAAAIGMQSNDIKEFIARLIKAMKKFKKKMTSQVDATRSDITGASDDHDDADVGVKPILVDDSRRVPEADEAIDIASPCIDH